MRVLIEILIIVRPSIAGERFKSMIFDPFIKSLLLTRVNEAGGDWA